MSKLDPFKARRSIAKIRLEDGLRQVNDLYWGSSISTQFASIASELTRLESFAASNPAFRGQGRLQRANIPQLLADVEVELPKFIVILLFSYFEPYLRDVCMSGVLSNPCIAIGSSSSINGGDIAADDNLLNIIERLSSPLVENWLKGSYAERFRDMRRAFSIPEQVTKPHVPILDDYYAKRNCIVHRQGIIDDRSKRYFQGDTRNTIGGQVNINQSDLLTLHKAIHDVADQIDRHMVENHIKNCEMLRFLHRTHRDHPDWKATDITREILRLRMDTLSRNLVARVLAIREK